MRFSSVLLFILMITSISNAQTRRMVDPFAGRDFSATQQLRTNWLFIQEADRHFRMFDFDASFLALENAVAQNPYSAEALILRAKLKRQVGMESEAKRDFQLAQMYNPYAASLYGYNGTSGLLNILSNRPELALNELSSDYKFGFYYESIDRQMIDSFANVLELEMAQQIVSILEEERYVEAEELIEKMHLDYPDSALSYDLKGLLALKKQEWVQAVSAFSEAIELEPDFSIAWYNLGQAEKQLGNMKAAESHFDRAISLQQSLVKAYFDRALLYKKIGEKEKAIEDYSRIIELDDAYYLEAFLNRGLTKKMLGDYTGALADFDQVSNEFPNNEALYVNRGNLQLVFGFPQKAIEDYTRAIQLDRQYAEAYYNRGLSHFLLFDSVSACTDLELSAELGYERAVEKLKYFCQ